MFALASLVVSFTSLLIAMDVWRRSFRPLVTAAIRTHKAGNTAITYDLVILNSGTLPARNIRIMSAEGSIEAALGKDASEENKKKWLACFNYAIAILQNNDRVSCSFGTTMANDAGFWKYNSVIRATVTYESSFGWFVWKYQEEQGLQISNSESFTGYMWGD